MGILKRDCPHCEIKSMAFRSFSGSLCDQGTWLIALQCNGCHRGYMVEVKSDNGFNPHEHNGNIEYKHGYQIIGEYPMEIQKNIPEYLPENIAKFYSQAITAFKGDSYDSSAMMSRKVLEVSVKSIHPEGAGSLYKRIESLAKEGIITNDLKEWAHIIREDGNESAHEEEPVTKEFAESILSFTELFLLYVFTMPGMVNSRKPVLDEVE